MYQLPFPRQLARSVRSALKPAIVDGRGRRTGVGGGKNPLWYFSVAAVEAGVRCARPHRRRRFLCSRRRRPLYVRAPVSLKSIQSRPPPPPPLCRAGRGLLRRSPTHRLALYIPPDRPGAAAVVQPFSRTQHFASTTNTYPPPHHHHHHRRRTTTARDPCAQCSIDNILSFRFYRIIPFRFRVCTRRFFFYFNHLPLPAATMKSAPMCRSGSNSGGSVSGGRVQQQHHRKRGDLEDEKIQKYLAKLKDLVPLIPKDKRISRLEVIHHVIDYICDLEDMLENHRSVNADAVHSAAAAVMLSSSVQAAVRQPLGIISTPNALAAAAAVAVQAAQPQSSSEPVSHPKQTVKTLVSHAPVPIYTSWL